MLNEQDRKEITDIVKNVIETDVTPKFDKIDTKFEQIDARFEQVDARFDEIDARFEQVDARFDEMDSKFNSLSDEVKTTRVLIEADIMPKFDLILDKISAMEEKLVPASRVEHIENDVQVLKMAVHKHSKEIKQLKEA